MCFYSIIVVDFKRKKKKLIANKKIISTSSRLLNSSFGAINLTTTLVVNYQFFLLLYNCKIFSKAFNFFIPYSPFANVTAGNPLLMTNPFSKHSLFMFLDVFIAGTYIHTYISECSCRYLQLEITTSQHSP